MAWIYHIWSGEPDFQEFTIKVSSSTLGLDTPEEIEERLKEYKKQVDEKGEERDTSEFIKFLKEYGYHVEVLEIDYTIQWDYKDKGKIRVTLY